VNLAPFVQQASSGASLLSYIGAVFLHGSMSPTLVEEATDAMNAVSTSRAQAQAALYVVLTSSEYQIIH
jgi:hypothetical protein